MKTHFCIVNTIENLNNISINWVFNLNLKSFIGKKKRGKKGKSGKKKEKRGKKENTYGKKVTTTFILYDTLTLQRNMIVISNNLSIVKISRVNKQLLTRIIIVVKYVIITNIHNELKPMLVL